MKRKKGSKKKKEVKRSVRNASRDGFDNVLRGLMVASGIMVSILIVAIFAKVLYKHRETHPVTVRRTLWTVGALIVTVLIYFFFPFEYFMGNKVKRATKRKNVLVPSTNNVVVKEALKLAPVIYTRNEKIVDSKNAVIMQNRDLSSKVDDFKEEDVLKYLNNLTSELEESEDFLQPVSDKIHSNSIELQIDGSRLLNIGFTQAHEIRLEIKCCETVAMTLVGTSITRSKRLFKCEHCSRVSRIEFFPRLVHQSCSTLGSLSIDGSASVSDVLRVSMFMSCLNCSGRAVMPSMMPRRGQIARLQCRNCFKQTEFECKSIKLITEHERQSNRKKIKKTTNISMAAKSVPLPGIQIGTPARFSFSILHHEQSDCLSLSQSQVHHSQTKVLVSISKNHIDTFDFLVVGGLSHARYVMSSQGVSLQTARIPYVVFEREAREF